MKYPWGCRYVAYLTDYYGRVGRGKILGRSRNMETLADRVAPRVPKSIGWDWHILDLETEQIYRPWWRGGRWVFEQVNGYIPGYVQQW